MSALARYQQRQAEEGGAYVLTETSATQLIVEDGQRRRRALRRQGPRQGRRAAGQLRARDRHQGQRDRARRGLLGPPDGRRDQGVRPRPRARAPGVGARGQGGLEGPEAARPGDPHVRAAVAAEGVGQVRTARRHLDVPDEGREDRATTWFRSGSSSTSTTATRPPRPTTCCRRSRRTRWSRASSTAASGSPGARRRSPVAATGRCRSCRCPVRCSSATPAGWSTRRR